MPDLRGLGARDAMRTLMKLGLSPHISGQGVVLIQDPAPGAPFERGDTCRLELGRQTAVARSADELP
jgi:beta-lactam-binding protein with PASTA domain